MTLRPELLHYSWKYSGNQLLPCPRQVLGVETYWLPPSWHQSTVESSSCTGMIYNPPKCPSRSYNRLHAADNHVSTFMWITVRCQIHQLDGIHECEIYTAQVDNHFPNWQAPWVWSRCVLPVALVSILSLTQLYSFWWACESKLPETPCRHPAQRALCTGEFRPALPSAESVEFPTRYRSSISLKDRFIFTVYCHFSPQEYFLLSSSLFYTLK